MSELFDWKGEAGDKFASHNPTEQSAVDAEWKEFYNVTGSEVMMEVIKAMQKEEQNLKVEDVKVFDIGCGTGKLIQ